MSVVRFIPNINRLAKAMMGPGGKPQSEAISDAEAAVQILAPPGVEAIDDALDAILAVVAKPGPLTPDMRESLYREANQINALGALFGLNKMGKAAWSLCEVLDLLEVDLPSGRPAIDNHVRSLQILRTGPLLPEGEADALLAGLASLLEHIRMESARR
jgi:hypothetical protein